MSGFTDAERESFGSEFDNLPPAVRVATLNHFSSDGGSLKARFDAIERELTGAGPGGSQGLPWALGCSDREGTRALTIPRTTPDEGA